MNTDFLLRIGIWRLFRKAVLGKNQSTNGFLHRLLAGESRYDPFDFYAWFTKIDYQVTLSVIWLKPSGFSIFSSIGDYFIHLVSIWLLYDCMSLQNLLNRKWRG